MLFLLLLLLTLTGCSYDYISSGTTVLYYKGYNDDVYHQLGYKKNLKNNCINNDDYFQIRISNSIFNDSLESYIEEVYEMDFTIDNELGIFFSLIDSEGKNEDLSFENRLVYSSQKRKKGEPMNFNNILVYEGYGPVRDYKIVIEVKEFDGKPEDYGTLDELSNISFYQHTRDGSLKLINVFSKILKDNLFKDETVQYYEVDFTSCNSVYYNANYLKEGYFLLLRSRQNGYQFPEKIKYNNLRLILNENALSYVELSFGKIVKN